MSFLIPDNDDFKALRAKAEHSRNRHLTAMRDALMSRLYEKEFMERSRPNAKERSQLEFLRWRIGHSGDKYEIAHIKDSSYEQQET